MVKTYLVYQPSPFTLNITNKSIKIINRSSYDLNAMLGKTQVFYLRGNETVIFENAFSNTKDSEQTLTFISESLIDCIITVFGDEI